MRLVSSRSLGLTVGLVVAMLLLGGCFQSAGEGVPPTQPGEAPLVVPPTWTPEPIMPTQPGEAFPAVQPTWTPELILPTQETIFLPTLTPTQLMQFGLPGDTPVVAPTLGLLEGQGGMEMPSAQADQSVLGPALTATAMIAAAQGQGFVPGGEAVAQFPTATPTFFAFQGQQGLLGPLESTATAMILGATQTVAFVQTQVATASGTYVPTATPTPPPPGFFTSTPTPSPDCTHVVVAGETLYRIARRYGVTVDTIVRANGIINPRLISPGQQLTIPNCGTTGVTPVPGQPTPTPGGATRTHLIRPGENLYRIALRYGVTMAALANANGITNVNYIRAGDTLIIP